MFGVNNSAVVTISSAREQSAGLQINNKVRNMRNSLFITPGLFGIAFIKAQRGYMGFTESVVGKLSSETTRQAASLFVRNNTTSVESSPCPAPICRNTTIVLVNTTTLKNNPTLFREWLVGLVDGDGTFSITQNVNNASWQFTFKISLHFNNLPLLHLIKEKLGCGSITFAGKNNWQYRVRNTEQLLNVIVPIFVNYPLHSRKAYHFNLFHQALLAVTSGGSASSAKCAALKAVWQDEQGLLDALNQAAADMLVRKPSKAWVIGFIEAEGSFYIVRRHKPSAANPIGEYCHGFGLSQMCDLHIIQHLHELFGMQSKPRKNSASLAWHLDTTNNRTISNVVAYFENALLGCKNVEFNLWSRAYLNPAKSKDMLFMQELQTKLRSLRFPNQGKGTPKN
ncbi:MAG TPA: LAGLIDADG family homing endonuclease [Methylotenera sp.]|nr:LAGLIDADG family homing endonuclease [Methylotenera sp.]